MHSATTTPEHRFDFRSAAASFAVFVLAGVMLAGCRSSRPSGSMVQVTEEPAAVAATLPAPEQRLATTRIGKAKSAADGQPAAEVKRSANGKPAAETTAEVSGDDRAASSEGRGEVSSNSIAAGERLVEDQAVSNRRATVSQASTRASVSASESGGDVEREPVEQAVVVPSKAAGESVGGLVSASLTDLSPPVASAKKPQVEQGAEASGQRAAANGVAAESVASRATGSGDALGAAKMSKAEAVVDSEAVIAGGSAEAMREPGRLNTGQPNGLDAALAGSLENLPSLPAASKTKIEGPQPTRIGEARGERGSQVMDQGETEPSLAMNSGQVKAVSHADDTGSLAAPKPVKRRVASAGNDTRSVKEWTDEELYQELLTRVSESGESDGATERERREIIARYLMVLAGEPESAVAAMDGLNADEQAYLKNHLLGLWTLIDPEGHPSSGRRITEALPQYRRAIHHMAAATDSLALASLEFCTEIEAYGQIKPFSGNRFNAGQQVIVYCEVENFSAAEGEGVYQTRLQGSYDIYDASGTKVVSQLLPLDEQRSRNRLRDYFVAYQMNLPKQLSPGTYRLQLTIEDLVGKKYGQSNIPFEIR